MDVGKDVQGVVQLRGEVRGVRDEDSSVDGGSSWEDDCLPGDGGSREQQTRLL